MAEPIMSQEFYAEAGSLPDSETEWAEKQATFRAWRRDPRFEQFWPIIDRLLAVDYLAARPWAVATEAIRGLQGYDFEAWRQQRDDELNRTNDQMP
jgi:hypothetical protein